MGDGTPIGQVRGLGSAKHGTGHWLLQRYTAAGNLVLLLWFAISIALLPARDYGAISGWLSGQVASTLAVLLIVSTFWHARLGLQVLIEDYVHEEGNKFGCLLALNLAAIAGATFGVMCVLRIALGGAA